MKRQVQQALIFDVDGTLIDSVDAHARSWTQAFANFGINVTLQSMRRLIGMGGDRVIAKIGSTLTAADAKALAAHRLRTFLNCHLGNVVVFPHTVDFLNCLQSRRTPFAFGSAATAAEMEAYKELIGIEKLSIPQARSDRVKASKPAPDVFLDARRQLDVPSSACIVIGDSVHDVQAAKNAGMLAIGVCSGAFLSGELLRSGCYATHDSISPLYKLFESTGSIIAKTDSAQQGVIS